MTVQRELNGAVAQAGYVGSRTVRPLLTMELNYALPGGGNTGRILNQYGRRRWAACNVPMDGTGRYDSLQATLTAGSAAASASDQLHVLEIDSWATSWMDPSQFHRNRALSSFDRPHNLQIGWVAELPFGDLSRPRASRSAASADGN